jgi:AcrR family transcriptional regulator
MVVMDGSSRSTGLRAVRGRRDVSQRGETTRGTLILDALERLLETTPIRDLAVEEIAQAAGITRTRFYAYFESKDAAFAALLDRVADEVLLVHSAPGGWLAPSPETSPRAAWTATSRGVVEVWLAHRGVLRDAADIGSTSPEVTARWEGMMAMFIKSLAAGIERDRELGVAPPGPDAEELAAWIVWGGERILLQRVLRAKKPPSKRELETFISVGVSLMLRAIYMSNDPVTDRIP